MPKIYYVYILASERRVLYVGTTSGIEHRVFQHKTHAFAGFTAKYNVTNLVYFERYGSVMTAIRREKEIKAWRRKEKIKLIELTNPNWRDLSYGWYQRHRLTGRRDSSESLVVAVVCRCLRLLITDPCDSNRRTGPGPGLA